MGLAARAHIVLGMHLEEAFLPPIRQDRRQVFVLEARAREASDRMGRKARSRCARGAANG